VRDCEYPLDEDEQPGQAFGVLDIERNRMRRADGRIVRRRLLRLLRRL
jgi:hypothetical protein